MSLHKFAEQVAAQGRGEDSLLVHMTPDEVRKLQQFAEANGTTLTINPHTGLPEAGLLSDFFKMVAPVALGAFLGPAGMGITFGGLSSAASAGLLTGGITTLATGSLSRGLMAGLGAYGGAGLAEGLGTAAVQGEVAANMPTLAGQAPEQVADYVKQVNAVRDTAMSNVKAMPFMDKMSSGIAAAADNPMNFAKQNLGNIAAAATPIMAGAMVPTTTKMPTAQDTGYIRQKLFDPYTHTYKSLAPVKASEWGGRSFSDAYTNPQTGIAAAVDPQSFKPMAAGGIVALAAGGPPPKVFTDEELYQQTGDWNKAAALRDAQNVAVSQYNATNNPTVGANINQWIVDNPFATAADINKAITSAGLTQDIVNPYLTANQNISAATRYALSHANEMPGAGGLAGMQANILKGFATPNLTQAQIDAEQKKYGVSDVDIQSPLSHGFQVADTDLAAATNYLTQNKDVQAWINSAEGKDYIKQHPEFDASDIAYTHYQRYGKGEGRKWEAPTTQTTIVGGGGNDTITGGGGNDTTTKIIDWKDCGTGYHWDKATQACVPNINSTQNTTTTVDTSTGLVTAPATSLPVGVSGTTGPSIVGGGATVNPNGTITTSPVIPGIPVGGFTGMTDVRNAYTKGGGSLGYVPYAPKTMAEFEQMYNTQTGDSLAAYNYLMGKGGGKYPVQSVAASTGINRPYWSGAARYKPKFLSYGKDGEITSSTTSGKTAGTADTASLTTAKTINVLDNQGNVDTATLRDDGKYYTSSGNAYDVTGKQIAAGGGMMGYAMGGGLGSLGSYSDGGRLLKGPGDGVSDSIPATIGANKQPARLADGEFVVPARIVSELGNGSTEAGAKKLYAMMDRVQKARGKTTGKNKVAANSRADKYLPA